MRSSIRWILALALCTAPFTLQAETLETVYFRANLSSANAVPPVADNAAGKATVTLHLRRSVSGEIISGIADLAVDYDVATPASATALHVQKGVAGSNGLVLIDSGINADTPVPLHGAASVYRQVKVSSALGLLALEELLANPSGFYLNVHTPAHPSGLLRGQLTRMERTVVRTALSSANIVPAIGLAASGSASVEILYTRDANGVVKDGRLYYDLSYNFPPEVTIYGVHLHAGEAGVNGPAQLEAPLPTADPIFDGNGVGTISYRVDVTSDGDLEVLRTLLADPAGAYLNLHTAAYPEGAIRGQFEPTTEMSYHFSIAPFNEVPPVALDAWGLAKVSIFATRDLGGMMTSGTVILDGTYGFPGAVTLQGFRIQAGAAGATGPVVVSSGLGVPNKIVDEDGDGNLHLSTNIGAGNAAGLAALMSITESPESFYLNLNTSANPTGALRGQLSGLAPQPWVADDGIVNATFAADVLPASPGSLVSIFGGDLAQVTGSAVVSNGKLTTNIAGTEVRIGGILAPLVYVSPTQINVQIPFEVVPGETTVVVTTPGGASVTRTLIVSSTSPAIFAVVKSSDFSLVTPENPVAPGGSVSVFVTGLGAGTPPVMTGQLAPANPPSSTAVSPISTIGGIGASVAASVLAPSFVGVYQVNVVVPPGTPSGPQQLQFSVDGIVSNTITIYIQ